MDDLLGINISVWNWNLLLENTLTALEKPGVRVTADLSSYDVGLWITIVTNLRCQNFNI
jgi:hypothetical protein